jgi:hypothetical protein
VGEPGVGGTAVACAFCGTVAPEGAPLDWTMQVERGRVQHICVACARDNLRAIEAKLAPEWW